MLIDSHCHLPHPKYLKSTAQIIEDAKAAGVSRFINIGTSLQDNLQNLQISDQYPEVYSALAIYPHEDIDTSLADLGRELEKQLTMSQKIVAVGECGLDITDDKEGRSIKDQIELLNIQLALALKFKLPVVIHNRGGDDQIFDILKPYTAQGLTGVAHCFSSTQDIAQQYLDNNFYISFSAMITYKGRDELREVAKCAPLDRILVETDAPYLPPQQFRGHPNEPKNVIEVAKMLSELRIQAFEKIAEYTYNNTCRLFSIS